MIKQQVADGTGRISIAQIGGRHDNSVFKVKVFNGKRGKSIE
jgi:hypothetical protein